MKTGITKVDPMTHFFQILVVTSVVDWQQRRHWRRVTRVQIKMNWNWSYTAAQTQGDNIGAIADLQRRNQIASAGKNPSLRFDYLCIPYPVLLSKNRKT